MSLALKGYPKISPETRERIQRAAESLGYSLDPMGSALATYRNRSRSPEDLGLAGLSQPLADTPLAGVGDDSTQSGTVAMLTRQSA